MTLARVAWTGCLALVTSCATTQPATANDGAGSSPLPSSAVGDTTGQATIPPGYGSLRQDDLSLHLNASSLLIRAIPLDESIIRLLTPDSYKALHGLKESYRGAIDAASRRHDRRPVSIWLVSFYGVQPDARFTPMDLSVTSSGRQFQPYDVLPLTTGFNEERLHQRETQTALYVFDGDIQLDQPLTVTYQQLLDTSWQQTLQIIERERAMIRARAGK